MKLIKVFAAIAVILATVICTLWVKSTFIDDAPTDVESLAPTLEKIQNLSELVTNKVYVSDILDANNKDYEGKWVINGDALITIDLSAAQLVNVDEKLKSATLILPEPQVTSPRVDHTRTKPAYIKGKRFALLRNPKNKEVMHRDMMAMAQKSIEKSAGRPEVIENSRRQAELVLSNLYMKVGWKLTIQWQGEMLER